jgi:hypothetical protein
MADRQGQETCAHSPYTRRVPTESLPPILTRRVPTKPLPHTGYPLPYSYYFLRDAQKPPYFPLFTPHPTYVPFYTKKRIYPYPCNPQPYLQLPIRQTSYPHRSSKQTYPFVKPIQRIYPRSVCGNKNIQYPFPSFILHTFIQYPPIAKTPVKTVESPTGKVRFFHLQKHPLPCSTSPCTAFPKKQV